MLTVGEEGSIIKELIQEMEQYLNDMQCRYVLHDTGYGRTAPA